MKKPLSEMSLKELFSAEMTDIIKLGRNYGIMTYDDVKEYLTERAKKELGEVPTNFYKLKKLILYNKLDNELESYLFTEAEMLNGKPSGAWEELKNSNLYKTLMV